MAPSRACGPAQPAVLAARRLAVTPAGGDACGGPVAHERRECGLLA
ncbi:MAG: hypothetical protein M9936_31975 [Caldilinea sp.]|nr:hypothetical protein [Caldilinea sp.]